ncbi:MAG: aryl-sulfate sulfohydrolase [Phycisphaerae bacterium]|nr:aryl-sulfate sulfohydrolase [Phycisphaerae bacterium]
MNLRSPWLVVLAVASIAMASMADTTNSASKPDVVVIIIDDMGWADPGFMPGGAHETPHMDALAARGKVFTQACSDGPNCAPSRATLMTGQWSPRHGITTVGTPTRGKAENRKLKPPPNGKYLTDDAVTLAERMKEAGYRTVHVGKWHLGDDPLDQGFDHNIGGNRAGHPKSYFSPYRNADLPDGPEGESLTDRLTDETLALVESDQDQPLFLYFSPYAVHSPFQATPEEVAALQAATPGLNKRAASYAAMMQRTDRNIGRLMERMDDDTIIIFCSDNGGSGGVSSNGDLRGAKGMLYEGGIRVPLVITMPGIESGTCEVPVTLMDVVPTILELADIDHPSNELDGHSLVPLLENNGTFKKRSLFWHFPAYLEAGGKAGPWRTTPVGVVREGDWKLLEFFEDGRVELYDLRTDPGETKNVAADHPETRNRLLKQMQQWRKDVQAPMPVSIAGSPTNSP